MSLAVEAWGSTSPIRQTIEHLQTQIQPQQSGLAHKRHRDALPTRGRS